MNEKMVPGDYVALGAMNIRSQMKTNPATNVVGGYSDGNQFHVYEVYAEENGIVWGRVNSNTGTGYGRFVALRVNNVPKAKLEKAEQTADVTTLYAVVRMADAIENLAEAIWALSRK